MDRCKAQSFACLVRPVCSACLVCPACAVCRPLPLVWPLLRHHQACGSQIPVRENSSSPLPSKHRHRSFANLCYNSEVFSPGVHVEHRRVTVLNFITSCSAMNNVVVAARKRLVRKNNIVGLARSFCISDVRQVGWNRSPRRRTPKSLFLHMRMFLMIFRVLLNEYTVSLENDGKQISCLGMLSTATRTRRLHVRGQGLSRQGCVSPRCNTPHSAGAHGNL